MMLRREILAAVFLLTTIAAAPPPAAPALSQAQPPLWTADDLRASFELRYGGAHSRLRIVSTTLLPGEAVRFAAVDRMGEPLRTEVEGGAGLTADGAWWKFAPAAAPAIHTLTVTLPGTKDSIRLNVFVAIPRDRVRAGHLNGYAIGDYPVAATIQGARVDPPRGFIEVTAANAGTRVSPRFTLGQFVCKQEGGDPRYVILDDRLPLKLEALIDRVRAEGRAISSLHVMSGYRTPAYNHTLRNVDYSRHVWGSAADVFVDEAPQDGKMDDLDGDGRIDIRDSEWLARLAESLEGQDDELIGGVGRYAATGAHGPFVHVDVRQRPARW